MDNQTKWTELLQQAVSEPGLILRAYSAFHGYSLSNQVAALIQCQQRQIEPGPINTYPGWSSLGRQVKKGEKALWLCMPLTRKKENEAGERETVITNFVWKPRWFTLAQTEGESVEPQTSPAWSKEIALAALNITEVAFTHIDGNVQGYAQKREVAVSPIAGRIRRCFMKSHTSNWLTQRSRISTTPTTRRGTCEKWKLKRLRCCCANP